MVYRRGLLAALAGGVSLLSGCQASSSSASAEYRCHASSIDPPETDVLRIRTVRSSPERVAVLYAIDDENNTVETVRLLTDDRVVQTKTDDVVGDGTIAWDREPTTESTTLELEIRNAAEESIDATRFSVECGTESTE